MKIILISDLSGHTHRPTPRDDQQVCSKQGPTVLRACFPTFEETKLQQTTEKTQRSHRERRCDIRGLGPDMKPRGAPSAFGLPPGRVGHSDTVGGAPAMSSAKSAQFGSHAAEVKVTPRAGKSRSGVETIQKPYTGMTIRLTPELLARLQQPGPRPEIELLLRSAGEGQFDFTTWFVYKYKREQHQRTSVVHARGSRSFTGLWIQKLFKF